MDFCAFFKEQIKSSMSSSSRNLNVATKSIMKMNHSRSEPSRRSSPMSRQKLQTNQLSTRRKPILSPSITLANATIVVQTSTLIQVAGTKTRQRLTCIWADKYKGTIVRPPTTSDKKSSTCRQKARLPLISRRNARKMPMDRLKLPTSWKVRPPPSSQGPENEVNTEATTIEPELSQVSDIELALTVTKVTTNKMVARRPLQTLRPTRRGLSRDTAS
ncbi:hypothetical protein V8E54_014436 [Elaphomyces granulatus]